VNSVEKLSDKEYYASYGNYMSVSLLKKFAENPMDFPEYLENRYEIDKPSDALVLGQAIHVCTLESYGDFSSQFSVLKDCINEKTGKPYGRKTNAWTRLCKEADISPWKALTEDEWDNVIDIATCCIHDSALGGIIQQCNRVEYALRGELLGLKFQGKMDAWNGDRLIFDLKTTQDTDEAYDACYRYKYAWQSLAYKNLLAGVLGCKPKDIKFYFGFVEKTGTYRTRLINSELIETEHTEKQFWRAIESAEQCKRHGDYRIGSLYL